MPTRARFVTLADKFLNNTFKDFAKDLKIVEEIASSDGQGGSALEQITFAIVKGFVFPQSGNESVKSGGLYTDQLFKFSLEPVAGLNNKMIIKYTDNDGVESDYLIESIVNVADANAWITLMAKKDTNS